MSQFFFNQRTRLVDDVIEGTIVASPWNNLARLESDPAIRVVVRRDLNKSNVAIISGGGAIGYYTEDNMPDSSYAASTDDPYAALAQAAAEGAQDGDTTTEPTE